MSEDRVQRRLAAILAADVVGYSRLMGEDEAGTLAALKQLRTELINPSVAEHHGRIVKLMGDGVLVEFASVVDAVECAISIQRSMATRNGDLADNERISFRIGVNLGDIIIDDGDIYGDGVNIAARLEGEADPGGICISADAYRQVQGKIDYAFEDVGERTLKNIDEPVRLYRPLLNRPLATSTGDGNAPMAVLTGASSREIPHDSRQRPVVAVLPFDNISGDPDQEYFADGITEDIITALSKHRWLQVIARNTTFGYKGKSPDVRKLAEDLGASYAVEGSVRRSGKRLRITAQLIDTTSGSHIWAERYDRDLEDIFALQDEITAVVVARVEPEVGFAERHRVEHMPRTNLQAWDCYHLAMSHFFKFTAADNLEAQRLFKRSFELDPDFGDAYAWWSYAVVLGMVYWDTEPNEALLDKALEATKRALTIDDHNAVFYMIMARVCLARRDYAASLAGNEAAVRLNPTFAAAYCAMGDALAYEGRYDESVDQFERAIALSPNDPQLWAFLTYGALALIFKGDFNKSLEWADRASIIPNRQYWTLAHMAVALAYLDRKEEARRVVSRLMREKPDFSVAFAQQKLFFLRLPEQLELYLDGLRKAGTPED